MRLVIHDFGRHQFTQLALALGARSHEVHYLHAARSRAPRASLERGAGSIWIRGLDPEGPIGAQRGSGGSCTSGGTAACSGRDDQGAASRCRDLG